jgi:hypothetical protein
MLGRRQIGFLCCLRTSPVFTRSAIGSEARLDLRERLRPVGDKKMGKTSGPAPPEALRCEDKDIGPIYHSPHARVGGAR